MPTRPGTTLKSSVWIGSAIVTCVTSLGRGEVHQYRRSADIRQRRRLLHGEQHATRVDPERPIEVLPRRITRSFEALRDLSGTAGQGHRRQSAVYQRQRRLHVAALDVGDDRHAHVGQCLQNGVVLGRRR
jgi:hypothetical protein